MVVFVVVVGWVGHRRLVMADGDGAGGSGGWVDGW